MRILLGVNTLTSVQNQVYANHLNFIYRLGKNHPDIEFILVNGYRTSIDRFRNICAKSALQHQCHYLMFLDDDVLVPAETFDILFNVCEMNEADIITPLTYVRGYPFPPMFFKMALVKGIAALTHYDDWKDNVPSSGLLDCMAIGFSCALIRCELLNHISEPYFMTGPDHTEDVYFCMKAKEELKGVPKIKVHTHIKSGHLLDAEFIHEDTREQLQRFYEDVIPGIKEKFTNDRNPEYLERVLKQFGDKFVEPETEDVKA